MTCLNPASFVAVFRCGFCWVGVGRIARTARVLYGGLSWYLLGSNVQYNQDSL